MTDTPKLTDAEATVMRRMNMNLVEWHSALDSLHTRGLRKASGATPIGLAALAAYDAEQRERIERDFLARTMVVESGLLIDTSSTATEAVDAQSVARRIERAKDGLVRKIRIAAMRECEILVEKKTQYSWRGGQHALRSAAAAIRLLIAKEESNG